VVGELDELCALAEVAVTAAVAVRRGNGRGAERAAVVATLEREHQALALLEIAHELEAVLDGLRAADIEVHAALHAELLLGVLGDDRREFDLLAVKILRGDLRQALELAMRGLIEARIAVAEVHGRIPHLQVQELPALGVVHERAVAAIEDLRRVGVVHRVAVRAVNVLELQELFFGSRRGRARCRGGAGIVPVYGLVHEATRLLLVL